MEVFRSSCIILQVTEENKDATEILIHTQFT